MLKIPSFILGGILILTGFVSFLVQDSSLSIRLTGPWASDAEFVLSDGDQNVMLDFMPCEDSAGENVWWIVHKLNDGHSKKTNEENYARKSGRMKGDPKSFWYASSSGETLEGLFQESENYSNAGTETYEAIPWTEIDVKEAKIRFIYNNIGGTDGPVTLSSSNWENVLNAPEDGEPLEFGKSWTAFIPGIIGLILILLAVAADKAPNAKKHIMHGAVFIGLLGFLSIASKTGSAFSEMSWLRSEPYLIYDASSLKPTSMLLSAGILLIYIILSVVSFITARKEMAAQAARDAAKQAAVLKKVSKRDSLEDDSKSKDGKTSQGAKRDENDPKKSSEKPKDSSSQTPKPKDKTESSVPKKVQDTTQGNPDKDKPAGNQSKGDIKKPSITQEKPKDSSSQTPKPKDENGSSVPKKVQDTTQVNPDKDKPAGNQSKGDIKKPSITQEKPKDSSSQTPKPEDETGSSVPKKVQDTTQGNPDKDKPAPLSKEEST